MPAKAESETSKIFFPAFPEPPRDADGNILVIYDVKKYQLLMPFYYWQKIVLYAVETEEALQALEPSERSKIFFPAFPEPPRDADGNILVIYDMEKDQILMPFYYWQKIVLYAAKTEEALQALEP